MYNYLFILLFMFGCSTGNTVDKEFNDIINRNTPEYPKHIYIEYNKYRKPENVQIIIIDSCEYIIGSDAGAYNGGIFMTHKGNCKFCKMRQDGK